jgi:nitroreductase
MEVKKAIETRVSIRKFKDKEIPNALMYELLEAARFAPSAYNAQPWRFVIIKEKETKEALKKNDAFQQKFVYEAPVILICCADPEVFPNERLENTYSNPDEIANKVGAVRDLTIAVQNLILRAAELGLGTCYVGLIKRTTIKKILGIPEHYILPYLIILGYPDEAPKASPRKAQNDLIIKEI